MGTMTASDRLTAIEQVKRSGFTDDERRIIEGLTVTNQILMDAPVKQANNRTVETHVIRTALPHGEHRKYYKGVSDKASQTKTVSEVVAQLASYSTVDKSLVDDALNPKEFLNGECASFIWGMGEDQADDIVYGNHTDDPSYINGWATRRQKLDNAVCAGMGGTGDALTSMYLVKLGYQFTYFIYPQGASGLGVQRKDLGEVTAEDSDGKKFQAYRNYFQADYGIAVEQEKSLIRICNINPSSVDAAKLVETVLAMKRKLAVGDGTICLYANADILGILDKGMFNKSNILMSAEDPWGRELTKIRDIRLRQVDSILSTESAVTA